MPTGRPRRVRKLRGHEPETWRLRIGSWRFWQRAYLGVTSIVTVASSDDSSPSWAV